MKKTSESTLFKRYRGLLQREFEYPNGAKIDFDIYDTGESIHVFALTPDHHVILAREFRPGPQMLMTELPGGMLNRNEMPLHGAQRELVEETGYQGNPVYIGKTFRNPYSTEVMHVIACTECKKIAEPKLDDNEFVETQVVTLAEFRKLLRAGELTNGIAAYMALEHLQLL